ncbi:Rho GTPase-activating protein 1 [Morella rubra]|uniref:Rho GTPase-activating protein 1 n=1 Tax=Morella rubra TaxID=262757 RepID=A0A6A1WCW0_9ROSI|nr:Rho GTPase-activating protein 1 [Morella rubra]KAB1223139.1 Rho GTPase-activating protein 1 [Morella rubra]
MTEVLNPNRSPSRFSGASSSPSSPSAPTRVSSSSSSLSRAPSQNDDNNDCDSHCGCGSPCSSVAEDGDSIATDCESGEEVDGGGQRRDQLSLLALLVAVFKKSLIVCKSTDRRDLCAMEIGWPTNVRHVAHVTFDRFNGFLGLPVEFEPEVPRRSPSASTTVFGVSTESMQLSFDSRGNSVPTILLLMQKHLYSLGGLQAEGIFRIAAENSQEEYVRDQLNRGVVPEGIDVHCLAGLIKAWFRELPTGVLDSLTPEQVMQCQTEEDYAELARSLPPTESALLDWAINLMADVVQEEHLNKMDARNVALMADPLTALMYAVQVMNFLKTLILKTLRDRKDSVVEPFSASHLEPYDENGHQSPPQTYVADIAQENEEIEQAFIAEEHISELHTDSNQNTHAMDGEAGISLTSSEKLNRETDGSCDTAQVEPPSIKTEAGEVNGTIARVQNNAGKGMTDQSCSSNYREGGATKEYGQQSLAPGTASVEKNMGISNLSRIDSRIERIEAWR